MKRLLLVSNDFLPSYTGVAIMMHHLANAFVQHGVDTLVIPPMREGRVDLPQRYRVLGTERTAWADRSPWYRIRARNTRLKTLLHDLLSDFQAEAVLLGIVANDCSAACVDVCRRRQLPLALCCHGTEVLATREGGRPTKELAGRLAGPLFGAYTSRQRTLSLIRSADRILANSHYTARLIRQVSGRNSVVTGCGISEDDWQRELGITPEYAPETKSHWKRIVGLPDRPTVGFVGRLVPNKNVALLLHALADLPEAQAVIVGEGECSEEWKGLAESLNVSRRVHWLGRLDEQAKWACMRAMDVFCLPSKELPSGRVEGFGIVLLEAAAAGTPAVAARSGGMTDVVCDAATGLLCECEEPASAAGAIRRLLTDATLARRCVTNARQQIRDRFNWDHVAGIVLAHLEQAIGCKTDAR